MQISLNLLFSTIAHLHLLPDIIHFQCEQMIVWLGPKLFGRENEKEIKIIPLFLSKNRLSLLPIAFWPGKTHFILTSNFPHFSFEFGLSIWFLKKHKDLDESSVGPNNLNNKKTQLFIEFLIKFFFFDCSFLLFIILFLFLFITTSFCTSLLFTVLTFHNVCNFNLKENVLNVFDGDREMKCAGIWNYSDNFSKLRFIRWDFL